MSAARTRTPAAGRPSLGLALLAAAGLLLLPAASGAVTVGFSCITGNDPADCATGVTQLSMEVTDIGGGQVEFTFANAGPEPSSITEIYFDDGSLLGIASLVDEDSSGMSGVDFLALGSVTPPMLPGGSNVGFQATTGFVAESATPPPENGVQASEYVGIVFDLQGGQTFANVVDELTDGSLRAGLRLTGLEGGGSESFVNVPVPEPGTAALLGLGLLGTAAAARRRRA